MKTNVYSWRLSEELKSELEREARLREQPVAALVELAVRDLLKKSAEDTAGETQQYKLHAAVEECVGVIAGSNPRRSEKVRKTMRKGLNARRRDRR